MIETQIRSVKEILSKPNETTDQNSTKEIEKNQRQTNTTTTTNSYPYETLPPAGNAGGLFLSSLGFSLLFLIIYRTVKKRVEGGTYG